MASRDSAWYDDQYNNRARVPEHREIFDRWADASRLVRERASRRIDLRYGEGPRETLDLFPAARQKAPVIVFIHGGYWRSFDKADHSFVAASFVADGAMVAMPNYALCPSVTIEQIALQTTRALAWVWRHAALYGGDPDRITVIGHSAGGHLAAMLLACRWKTVGKDLPDRLVSRAMAISGLFDMEPLRRAPSLQKDLRLTAESVARLSPARFPAPPGRLFAVVGAQESQEFRRQTQLIRKSWGARAVPVCEEVAGCHHFDILHDLVDPQGRTHRLAAELAIDR